MVSLPDRLLTLQEWDELPEEGHRWAELAEGVVQVSPSPGVRHQFVLSRLHRALDQSAQNAGLVALTDIDVTINAVFPPTVRQPAASIVDLSVISADPKRLVARDVLLAVEIVSPGSGRQDRVTKLSEYAGARIANYWILEITGPSVVLDVFELDGQAYRRIQHREGGAVVIMAPFALALDLDALRAW